MMMGIANIVWEILDHSSLQNASHAMIFQFPVPKLDSYSSSSSRSQWKQPVERKEFNEVLIIFCPARHSSSRYRRSRRNDPVCFRRITCGILWVNKLKFFSTLLTLGLDLFMMMVQEVTLTWGKPYYYRRRERRIACRHGCSSAVFLKLHTMNTTWSENQLRHERIHRLGTKKKERTGTCHACWSSRCCYPPPPPTSHPYFWWHIRPVATQLIFQLHSTLSHSLNHISFVPNMIIPPFYQFHLLLVSSLWIN